MVEDIIDRVRKEVGSDKVILGMSGGVDSSVVAALLSRAIGSQLTCVFVDNGLLRHDEANQVEKLVGTGTENLYELNLVTVPVSDRFLSRLVGVTDPEEKRKVIGNTLSLIHI